MLVFIIHIRRYTLIFERCDIVLRLCLLRIAVQFLRDLPFILSFFTTRLFIPVQTLFFFHVDFFSLYFELMLKFLVVRFLPPGVDISIYAHFSFQSLSCVRKKNYIFISKLKPSFMPFFMIVMCCFFFSLSIFVFKLGSLSGLNRALCCYYYCYYYHSFFWPSMNRSLVNNLIDKYFLCSDKEKWVLFGRFLNDAVLL